MLTLAYCDHNLPVVAFSKAKIHFLESKANVKPLPSRESGESKTRHFTSAVKALAGEGVTAENVGRKFTTLQLCCSSRTNAHSPHRCPPLLDSESRTPQLHHCSHEFVWSPHPAGQPQTFEAAKEAQRRFREKSCFVTTPKSFPCSKLEGSTTKCNCKETKKIDCASDRYKKQAPLQRTGFFIGFIQWVYYWLPHLWNPWQSSSSTNFYKVCIPGVSLLC